VVGLDDGSLAGGSKGGRGLDASAPISLFIPMDMSSSPPKHKLLDSTKRERGERDKEREKGEKERGEEKGKEKDKGERERERDRVKAKRSKSIGVDKDKLEEGERGGEKQGEEGKKTARRPLIKAKTTEHKHVK
jgi:hypothetical protein